MNESIQRIIGATIVGTVVGTFATMVFAAATVPPRCEYVRLTTNSERYVASAARHFLRADSALRLCVEDGVDFAEYQETVEGKTTVSESYYNAVFTPSLLPRLTPERVGLKSGK